MHTTCSILEGILGTDTHISTYMHTQRADYVYTIINVPSRVTSSDTGGGSTGRGRVLLFTSTACKHMGTLQELNVHMFID